MRTLAAAVAVQALYDAAKHNKRTAAEVQADAVEFLRSDVGQLCLKTAGIPAKKIYSMLGVGG